MGQGSAAWWWPRTSATSTWGGRPSRCRSWIADVSTGRHRAAAAHSLSKRSNLAGYRPGSSPVTRRDRLAGGTAQAPRVILPTPVQAAAAAALSDDRHVMTQRSPLRQAPEVLMEVCDARGFRIGDGGESAAGLYLLGHVAAVRLRSRCSGWPNAGSWSPRARSSAPSGAATSWIALTATTNASPAAVSASTLNPVRRHPSAGIACGPAAALAALRDRGPHRRFQFDHEKLHAKYGVSRV